MPEIVTAFRKLLLLRSVFERDNKKLRYNMLMCGVPELRAAGGVEMEI